LGFALAAVYSSHLRNRRKGSEQRKRIYNRGIKVSIPESLMIDGVKYVRVDAMTETSGEVMIAVLDRGFVYVGRVEWNEGMLILRNAKCIRKWGTTKGIGELVNGPLSGTVLDTVGTVHVPERAVISLIEVVAASWKGI
jgi:hypothetical protein